MSFVIPQGNNRKVKKTAIKIIYLEGMEDPFEHIEANGNTPHYFLFDPEDTEVCYVDIKPFTLEQAKKETGYDEEEE